MCDILPKGNDTEVSLEIMSMVVTVEITAKKPGPHMIYRYYIDIGLSDVMELIQMGN